MQKRSKSYKKIKTKKPAYNKRRKSTKRSPKWKQGQVSRGEQEVMFFLRSKGISYIHEAEFSDCFNPKTQALLRFDFFLPMHQTTIEFDGPSHQMYVPEFDGKDPKIGAKKLADRQFKDSVKDDYCKRKGFKMLRIPYTKQSEITEIISKFLNL